MKGYRLLAAPRPAILALTGSVAGAQDRGNRTTEDDYALLPPAHPPAVSARRASVDVDLLDYLQRAFHGGLILPVLGFIFLPLTTIVYAWNSTAACRRRESIFCGC